MAFEYGSDNRFDDQYFVKGANSANPTCTALKCGDTNGGLAIVVCAKTACAVSGFKLSITCSDTEGGSYAAPTNSDVLTFGGTSYAAGEILGYYIIPNGVKEWVKPSFAGTFTSGTYDVYLRYIAR